MTRSHRTQKRHGEATRRSAVAAILGGATYSTVSAVHQVPRATLHLWVRNAQKANGPGANAEAQDSPRHERGRHGENHTPQDPGDEQP